MSSLGKATRSLRIATQSLSKATKSLSKATQSLSKATQSLRQSDKVAVHESVCAILAVGKHGATANGAIEIAAGHC